VAVQEATAKAGITCCDLFLKLPNDPTEVPVELKGAGNNWYFGGGKAATQYKEHLLAFLCVSESPLRATHQKQAERLDANVQIAPICQFNGSPKNFSTFYFALADLRSRTSPNA
jgi:hypothetical protein